MPIEAIEWVFGTSEAFYLALVYIDPEYGGDGNHAGRDTAQD